MRIGFVGCGAIGSCYASFLLSKHEVCVLDTYEPVIENIKKHGILIDRNTPGYGNGETVAYFPTIATTDPKEIGAIARGDAPGDKEAAIKAFDKMGEVAGDAIATAVTLIDGLVVIGGGIMNNHQFLMPGILRTMRSKIHQLTGEELNRVQMKVYNLDDPDEFGDFARGEARKLKVYGSDEEVVYDPQKRIGIMRSKIGASKAISLGAYAFALSELDK